MRDPIEITRLDIRDAQWLRKQDKEQFQLIGAP